MDRRGKRSYEHFEINMNYTIKKFFNDSPNCSQSIDQLCQPWLEELYFVDRNGTGGHNRLCRCIRYTTWFDQEYG